MAKKEGKLMRRGTTTYRDSSRMFFEISFPLCLFRGGPSNRSLADKRRVNTNDEPWDPLIPSHSPGRIPVFKNVLWLLLRAVLLKRSSSIACFRRSNVASSVDLDTSREKWLVWRSFEHGGFCAWMWKNDARYTYVCACKDKEKESLDIDYVAF